jgi:hypothetical protein
MDTVESGSGDPRDEPPIENLLDLRVLEMLPEFERFDVPPPYERQVTKLDHAHLKGSHGVTPFSEKVGAEQKKSGPQRA